MSQLQGEIIAAGVPSSNMNSYEEACANFNWNDVESSFPGMLQAG
ncbi:hypothetical protein HMSSN036_21860 [Paenibacillus macerans]|nr:hypothetical protein HMSSN036_21860 [Paenibacillus macerans]